MMAMKYSWFHHHDCTTEQADTLMSDYQKRGVRTEKSLKGSFWPGWRTRNSTRKTIPEKNNVSGTRKTKAG
ncbi:hypothetical protein G3E37_003530 [Salmonella enterica subsp. enterica]|nr:hypothetical protein [Salmonella enterica subsp. enterica]